MVFLWIFSPLEDWLRAAMGPWEYTNYVAQCIEAVIILSVPFLALVWGVSAAIRRRVGLYECLATVVLLAFWLLMGFVGST